MSEATVPERRSGIVPNERAPRPIDPGVDIGHVHLKAADLSRIRAFYVDILGFDVVFHAPDALFIAAGSYHHTLGFNTWHSRGGSPPPPQATGLYHVAIRYPTRAALGDALRRMAAAGWPIDGFNDHGTHEAIYLRDPEENGLELCWDRSPEEWPRDAEGHLAMSGRRLDLDGLFREGQEAGQQEETAQLEIRSGVSVTQLGPLWGGRSPGAGFKPDRWCPRSARSTKGRSRSSTRSSTS